MRVLRRTLWGLACASLLTPVGVARNATPAAASAGPTVTPLVAGGWRPTNGSDGNVWFTKGSTIGKVTPGGVETDYPVPGPAHGAADLTLGPDGNIWFVDGYFPSTIGSVSPTGDFVEFALGHVAPTDMTGGPDGNIWITVKDNGELLRVTTAGAITEFPLGDNQYPTGITRGPDGNLWFLSSNPDAVNKFTPTGERTEFPDGGIGFNTSSDNIVALPDGDLAFANYWIYRVTTAGAITQYPTHATDIGVGPGGSIWYDVQGDIDGIGRLGADGTSDAFFPMDAPWSPMTGPDGALWFTTSPYIPNAPRPAVLVRLNPTGATGTALSYSGYGPPIQAMYRADVMAPFDGGIPTGSVQPMVDGQAYGSPVDLANGRADITITGLGAGYHTVTAQYSGDGTHESSVSQTRALTITIPTAITAQPALLNVGSSASQPLLKLSARLVRSDTGAPLPGRELDMSVPPITTGNRPWGLCWGITDANGVASCQANLNPGLVSLLLSGGYTVSFQGEGLYQYAYAKAPVIGPSPPVPAIPQLTPLPVNIPGL